MSSWLQEKKKRVRPKDSSGGGGGVSALGGAQPRHPRHRAVMTHP